MNHEIHEKHEMGRIEGRASSLAFSSVLSFSCLSCFSWFLLLSGCIQRTITLDSAPQGAVVYLNDEEVGRTPVTVPFTFYGTYDVRVEKEEFATIQKAQEAKGPWWEAPGPDLVVEVLPWTTRVDLKWFFTLAPAEQVDEKELVRRASELREQAE